MAEDGSLLVDLDTGNDDKIEIRCSSDTKTAMKKLMADVDPNITYEELLIAVIRTHRDSPEALEKNAF